MSKQHKMVHNLPQSPPTFIGRERECTEIAALLNDPGCRLLTLVGPGGIGKTRLAIEAARFILDTYSDGVHFIPLQPLQSPDQVLPTIIDALSVEATGDLEQHLLDYLDEKHVLLVLDNFEHVLGAADLLSHILVHAPQIKFLVTSREVLKIREEWVRAVVGLTYPEAESPLYNNHFSAVELFSENARRLRRDFSLDRDYYPVVRICHLVEGMPLALELAAAWTTTLTCTEIADEIQRDLEILISNTHNLPDRHRSMLVVFDHSWRLLTDEEQRVVQHLSVFRGGCTREAAEQITGATLPILASLVAKSMLRHDIDKGRYDVHELLRQYAGLRLEESNTVKAAGDAHSKYYATRLHQLRDTLRGSGAPTGAAEIELEFYNIQVAWCYALAHGELTSLYQMSLPLADFGWLHPARISQILDLYETALDKLREAKHAPQVHRVYGHLLGTFSDISFCIGYKSEEAYQMALESLSIARECGDPFDIAYVLFIVGWRQTQRGDYESALVLLEESYQRFMALRQPIRSLHNLQAKAICLKGIGKDRSVVRIIEQECIELASEADAQFELSVAYLFASKTLLEMGDYARSEEMCKQGLTIEKQIKSDTNQSLFLNRLAILATLRGDYSHAEKLVQDFMKGNAIYDPVDTATCLIRLADIRSLQGQHEAAQALLLESRHVWSDGDQRLIKGILAYRRGEYDYAQAQFQQLLSSEIPDGDFRSLVSLHFGLVLIQLRQIDVGMQYLRDGLKGALTTQYRVYYPLGLYGFAEALSHTEQKNRAVELATMISHHAVTPHEIKIYAQQLLAKLANVYSSKYFAEPALKGQSLDLETTVKEFIHSEDDPIARANQSLPNPLTPKELEVLQLVAEGFSNPQIAERLFITTGTVKVHANRIYHKLNAENRVHATKLARDLRLLSFS